MTNKKNIKGKLIGSPFIASIDIKGDRSDKSNCAYIVNGYFIPKGYKAYIFDASYPNEYVDKFVEQYETASIVFDVYGIDELVSYDVVSVSDRGIIQRVYRDDSEDNVLFITNRCNSNCIMCPDSVALRTRELDISKEYLFRIIDLIPNDTKHLTITGGEPTLLKWDLLHILQKCKDKFTKTLFLMLSNGRSFCVDEYRNQFLSVIPSRFRLGVPLYGSDATSHDSITQAEGSFKQTMQALKVLQHHIEIEIRIVVMSLDYEQLPAIAHYIAKNIPQTYTVSFMGMELLGSAAVNRDNLWVDYSETVSYLEEAIITLLNAGIDTRIYNYPLCALPERLWHLASKSISDYKVRYKTECEMCTVKQYCGGFFFSTISYNKVKINPVLEESNRATMQ